MWRVWLLGPRYSTPTPWPNGLGLARDTSPAPNTLIERFDAQIHRRFIRAHYYASWERALQRAGEDSLWATHEEEEDYNEP
jgi:hypothetical protein